VTLDEILKQLNAVEDEPEELVILPFPRGKIERRERLGGLLNHYQRKAA